MPDNCLLGDRKAVRDRTGRATAQLAAGACLVSLCVCVCRCVCVCVCVYVQVLPSTPTILCLCAAGVTLLLSNLVWDQSVGAQEGAHAAIAALCGAVVLASW